jgi:hypothetical protein
MQNGCIFHLLTHRQCHIGGFRVAIAELPFCAVPFGNPQDVGEEILEPKFADVDSLSGVAEAEQRVF